MKRLAAILIVVAALLSVPLTASHADRGRGGGGRGAVHGAWRGGHGSWRGQGGGWHGGGRHHWHGGWHSTFIVGGPLWWGGWDPYWYSYPYPVYYPLPVERDEPSVYVQQETESSAEPQGYWYYCPSAKAYYPKVETCREAWVKVPPRPQ